MPEPNDAAPVSYWSYLALDELLAAQRPRSDEHDELLFIVIHQVSELWFKQLLHELAHLQERLEAGDAASALGTLRRALTILKTLVGQMDVLETLTPREFATFRDRLGPASGFQSAQFRVLEAVLGGRDPRAAALHPAGSPARATIEAAMARPALFDSLLRHLAGAGYALPVGVLERDVTQAAEPDPEVQEVLLQVYADEGLAAQICERMVDLDEGVQEWRYRHVKLIERTIGHQPGTGGSTGADFLRRTLFRPAFPDLWAVRSRLLTALADLRSSPNALAPHYARFGVAERLLLTGHSHQAWPDVALEGQVAAFDDAARHVDDKWDRAFAQADAVRAGLRPWLGDPGAELALGTSTHELVVRMLSALDLRARPRLVSTDGEFHTLRRQLGRAAEAGLEVVRVAAAPAETLAARLAAEVDDRTAAVLVSAVLFERAEVVPGLDGVAAAAARHGAELLVDVYHALGPVPFSVGDQGLHDAWIVGGGYKYLQLGEGNCFLRVPAHAEALRPVITGWYAEFGALADRHDPDRVAYGHGAQRFAGATYDPTSHYRAARVQRFFADHGLTPELLAQAYRHQVARLAAGVDALDLPPAVVDRDRDLPAGRRGGFLALRSPQAAQLQDLLARRGVLTDSRGDVLRLGPAPYLSDEQLDAAVDALGEAVAQLR